MSDELLRRFADLNPVEDPDRFVTPQDPFRPSHPALRAVLEQARDQTGPGGPLHEPQSEEMRMRTDMSVRTERTAKSGRRPNRGWMLATAAAVVVVAVVAGVNAASLVDVLPEPVGGEPALDPTVTDPALVDAVDVAEAYLAAIDDHDADAARRLLADDIAIDLTFFREPDELAGFLEAARLHHFRFSTFECDVPVPEQAGPTVGVSCVAEFDSRLQEIVDYPPVDAVFLFGVSQGRITSLSDSFPISEFDPNVFQPFRNWLNANHPDGFNRLYEVEGGVAYMRLEPEALELIPGYLDEYEQSRANG